eukprot:3329025-Amphidinium_carterae.1
MPQSDSHTTECHNAAIRLHTTACHNAAIRLLTKSLTDSTDCHNAVIRLLTASLTDSTDYHNAAIRRQETMITRLSAFLCCQARAATSLPALKLPASAKYLSVSQPSQCCQAKAAVRRREAPAIIAYHALPHYQCYYHPHVAGGVGEAAG